MVTTTNAINGANLVALVSSVAKAAANTAKGIVKQTIKPLMIFDKI